MTKPTEEEDSSNYNNSDDDFHTQNAASNDWETFFKSFKQDEKYYYVDKIQELVSVYDKTLLIRATDFSDNDRLFSYIFKDKNVEMNLRAMTDAARSIYTEFFPGTELEEINLIHAKLSIDDPLLLVKLQDINMQLKQKVIVFNCIIVSQTENKPVLKQKIWVCKNCDTRYTVKRTICTSEVCKRDFKDSKAVFLSIAASIFVDCQIFEVQERQVENSSMTTPKQLVVKVYGHLVDKFKAGDHIQVIGFPKLHQLVSDADLNRAEKNDEFSNDLMFDLVIEAHHIQYISSSGNEVIEDPAKLLTSNDIALIKETKKKYDNKQIMEKLRNCFAYWVHGNDQVKDMIIWQSVGSVSFDIGKDKSAKKRGEINFLIVGDPGVVKTVLLRAALGIHTKSIFATGKGSSGVGLTASIDTTQKGLNKLRIGAVVLADNGICCCDEFLLISEDSQEHLLQCMENGIININKQGINVVLNARTAILGACNPVSGKYNIRHTLAENVPLSAPIWSRWDCVTVIRDISNNQRDSEIADYILSQYDEANIHKYKRPADDEFLFKWLIYARTNNKRIKFTPQANKKLKEWYKHLRRAATEFDVSATPRQIDASARISIAIARTLLEDTVTEDIVDIMIENLKYHYESAGLISSETGGMVQTTQYSMPLNKLTKKSAFLEVMTMLTRNNTQEIESVEVEVELIKKAGWSQSETRQFVQNEIDSGRVIQTRIGYIKLPSSII